MGFYKILKLAKKKDKIRAVRLDSSHKDQTFRFIREVLEISKKRKQPCPWDFDEEWINESLSSRHDFPALFGAFRQKELLSTFGVWKWTALPYGTIGFRLVKGYNYFNPQSNGQSALLEKAVEYASRRGLLAFYSCQKKRSLSLALRHAWKAPKNYFSYTEAIIPKGVKPKEIIYWAEIMDKKIMPWPIEIRRLMPKPKLLKGVNWPKG